MSNGMPPGDSQGAEPAQSPWVVAPVQGRSYAESLAPAPVAAPVKRPRFPRPSPLLVGIVSLLILVACFGAFGVGYEYRAVRNQSGAPASVLRQFCAAETRQDYQAAFALMAPAYQKQFSVDDWAQSQVQRDQTYGTVASCSGISRNLSYGLGQSHAAFDVTVTYSKSTQRGHVILEFASNVPGYSSFRNLNDPHHWFVDQIDATFRLGG